ncbi:MAG TPA: hypothetical protein VGE39_24920 [Prosthecobacter sp.]
MSFPTLTAAPTSTAPSARSGVELAHELSALVDEIQRTRDWFNTQIEAQLSSLRHLKATMQMEDPMCRASVSTLFDAAPPMVAVETLPPASPVAVLPAPAPVSPSNPVFALSAFAPVHQAVVLPPTAVSTLDPELEQATLRELNDALSRAFAEISSRGGMLA